MIGCPASSESLSKLSDGFIGYLQAIKIRHIFWLTALFSFINAISFWAFKS
jgi:hypothetical protein